MQKEHPTEKTPLNDRSTPREEGGKVTVPRIRLVFKSQLVRWYGESRYLFNKNFMIEELRKLLNIENYQSRQYFKPEEFQIIIDFHQLSDEEKRLNNTVCTSRE